LFFFYERIFEYDALLKTVIALNPNALDEAIQLDAAFAKRNYTITGRLHCIPILVKDNIDVAGMPTTGGLFALNDSSLKFPIIF
jgi:amidase